MRMSHSASNIVAIINTHLDLFGIRLNQVISVTTDNGKDVVKAIAVLEHEMQNEQNEQQHDVLAQGDEEESDSDVDDIGLTEIFDERYYTDILSVVRSAFEGCHKELICGVSCACHCLHLILMHAIKKEETFDTLIKRARELCKKLRTPTMKQRLKDQSYNYAFIDVETRWNSTYCMVSHSSI